MIMKLKSQTKTLGLTLLGLFLIALPLVVFAAGNQSIFVSAEEIIEGNFIKAGNIIDIEGAVNGAVIVAGNSITIAGPVAGDVIAAGNIIRINGPVSGSVRLAGSSVEINNEVKHNVWVAAGTLSLSADSRVGWDVFGGAGSIEIQGPVRGNVWAGPGSLALNNQVGKNVTAALDREGQIILSSQASIAGDLVYKAANQDQLVINDGAEIKGQTNHQLLTPDKVHQGFGAAWLFFKVIAFFSLLIVGVLLISLAPKWLLQVEAAMIKRPGASLGWGLVGFFLVPILCLFLLLTIIGIPLALMMVPVYLILIYLSKVVAGFVLGLWLLNKLTANKYTGSLIWPLVLGLLVLLVVASLPLVGWLIGLVFVWWSLGGLIQVKKETLKDYR